MGTGILKSIKGKPYLNFLSLILCIASAVLFYFVMDINPIPTYAILLMLLLTVTSIVLAILQLKNGAKHKAFSIILLIVNAIFLIIFELLPLTLTILGAGNHY